eukprot:scaffold50278_cov52-Attheya_sp.AAC.2
MTADWPQLDSSVLTHVSLSSDLFGGELFGDELMDMYSSAAVVESESPDVIMSEIPTLLPGTGNSTEVDDDGLGAFRPSTSFNDFSSLLTENKEAQTAPSGSKSQPKKRKADATIGKKYVGGAAATAALAKALAEGPVAKKRATVAKPPATVIPKSKVPIATARRVSKSSKPSPVVSAGPMKPTGKPAKLSKNKETPNPLGPSRLVVPPMSKVNPNVVTPKPVPSSITTTQKNVATVSASVRPVVLATRAPTSTVAAVPLVIKTSGTMSISGAAANSEADFKSVAQAAVSSLIMHANGKKPVSSQVVDEDGDIVQFTGKVDTSTAHIAALTSPNWVAACSGIPPQACLTSNSSAVAAAAVADSKSNNRSRRANLTPDERARQNRDRNREHARNTRLRKKAYVEELKSTLTELVAQRDRAELERRQTAQRELEQREVRFRVMEEFLHLRGRNEPTAARWSAILEDGFTFTLPVTHFRAMAKADAKGKALRKSGIIRASNQYEQVLTSVAEVMADSAQLGAFLGSIGMNTHLATDKAIVSIEYSCDRSKFFMDGCNAVLDWTATTIGAVHNGAGSELKFRGIVRAKFSPESNKLVSASLDFDTGSIAMQLRAPVIFANIDEDGMAAAAQVAANAADALLDSLEMPHLDASSMIPSAVSSLNSDPSPASVTSSEKDDNSSDDDFSH